MDSRQTLPAVATVDHQSDAEVYMDPAQIRRIWRWLDAIHDREPPQEQPAFEYSDTSPTRVPSEDHKAKVFKRYQHQLSVNQAEKPRLWM